MCIRDSGRIKSAGAVWGEDFVLAAAHPECIDASAAMALTYVHVTRLSGEQLEVRATLSRTTTTATTTATTTNTTITMNATARTLIR